MTQFLFVAVSDPALGQIVWRELQGNPVTIHYPDPVAPEPSAHGSEHGLSDIQFDGKHSGPELVNYLTHHFNRIFFRQ